MDWALTQDVVTAPKQLLLVALAWVADEDGVTIKGQKAIAERLGKDPRWVREHMGGLAAVGLISRYRRHRLNGSRTTDLTVLNLPRDAPLDMTAYSGIVGDLEPGDVEPSGGNPPGGSSGGITSDLAAGSRQPSGGNPPGHPNSPLDPPRGQESSEDGMREGEADAFPDDLPDELHEPAIAAGKILKRTAQQRGQRKPVTRAAVGHAVLTFADRDHVRVAREVEAWLLHGRGARQPCRDVVARFRRFLETADPMPGPPMPGVAPTTSAGPSPSSATLREMAEQLRTQGQ